MGPSDRGDRPGSRTAPRWMRELRARGRYRVRAAGLRSSQVGRFSAVGSSAVGEPRLFAWDSRNASRARSVALRGLCVVGLVLSANAAEPYEQIEPARRNEEDRVSREVGERHREGPERSGRSSGSRRDIRHARSTRTWDRARSQGPQGGPALEGQDPSDPSTLAILRAPSEGRLDTEASSTQGCRRERGALTRWFQGSRRGTGRVCEPDDASRADLHDETGRAARARSRGLERLLRRAERRSKRARRLTAPGWFPTFRVGVCTPTSCRPRRP